VRHARASIGVALLATAIAMPVSGRQQSDDLPIIPQVNLVPADTLWLPGPADSNSPGVWDRVSGRNVFFLFTSVGGVPWRSFGGTLTRMRDPQQVSLEPWSTGGYWLESIVKAEDGTWYGYYHYERETALCQQPGKVVPSIGAVRSRNQGQTWQDLGIILEAPPDTHDCDTVNRYFVGGVGDFSVLLDTQSRDLYFFLSQYVRGPLQGVSVARLAWADRDAPVGKITLWHEGVWLPASAAAGADENPRWTYPAAVPLFLTSTDRQAAPVDTFWGPSVHWNTYLQQYVMLLNRSRDTRWRQEGIYISFSKRLDNPRLWSPPMEILDGGSWYPQVVGLEPGSGTDKVAGRMARFFMTGESNYLIAFER
jgi:hypothetical protein